MFTKFVRAATVVLASGALMAGSVVATPSASANVNRNTTPDIGVQFHGLWTDYSDAQRNDILEALHDAGITTVRLDVSWAMFQPVNGTSYDPWGTAFVDRVIALCNAHGITPLVTLWLTPGWANHNAGLHALPTDVADYARVARWAAARYTNKVAGWEVWNEENSPAFLDGANATEYTDLLRAAYPAFHAGYPGTTVVFGGLEYNDTDWISRAYAAGAHGYFDVMATHPYMGMANLSPYTADDGTKWTLMHAIAVHNLMAAHGDAGKSLWFTEFGWSTHANSSVTPNWELGVTEAVQAQYFTETVTLIRTTLPWVGKVYWYADPDADTAQKANYGVLRLDLSPKPILYAISAATH
jgi:hypothetical protein